MKHSIKLLIYDIQIDGGEGQAPEEGERDGRGQEGWLRDSDLQPSHDDDKILIFISSSSFERSIFMVVIENMEYCEASLCSIFVLEIVHSSSWSENLMLELSQSWDAFFPVQPMHWAPKWALIIVPLWVLSQNI